MSRGASNLRREGRRSTGHVGLVTAHDIARARLAARPSDTIEDGMARMMSYYQELYRAVDEKARGEWVITDRRSMSP